ncbi:MAG: hypothetical protein AAFO17_03290, partial [Pseudomonadota bacterium]
TRYSSAESWAFHSSFDLSIVYFLLIFFSRNKFQGGTIDAEFELPDGPAVLVRDPHGAAFILLKSSSANQVGQSKNALMGWVGLGLMVFSIFSQQFWPWAIFMGIWMVQGLRQRETWLLTQVRRDREPVLYWLSLTFFAFIAAYSAVFPFGAAR